VDSSPSFELEKIFVLHVLTCLGFFDNINGIL